MQESARATGNPYLGLIAVTGYEGPGLSQPPPVRGPPPPVPAKVILPPAPKPKPPAKAKVIPLKDEYLHLLLSRAYPTVARLPAPLFKDDYIWREDIRGHLMFEAMRLHTANTSERAMIPKEVVKMCKLADKYCDFLKDGVPYL